MNNAFRNTRFILDYNAIKGKAKTSIFEFLSLKLAEIIWQGDGATSQKKYSYRYTS